VLRTSAASPIVTLTAHAFRSLRQEIFEYDGDEHGGGLFGHRHHDAAVVVERVCGASEWAEREPGRFRIEPDRYRAIEQNLPSSWFWIGDWHVHDEREPRPSQADFDGWRAAVRSALGLYVGVVATTWLHGEDWSYFEPRFACWVAQEGECRPATLTLEG
jgi:hypothetical protein